LCLIKRLPSIIGVTRETIQSKEREKETDEMDIDKLPSGILTSLLMTNEAIGDIILQNLNAQNPKKTTTCTSNQRRG